MKILCDITPVREEKVAKGRYTGQEAHYKYVIAGDNWCWNISRINYKADGSEYPAQGQAYLKGFTHLLSVLPNYNIDPETVIPTIISALEKNTGRKFDQDSIKGLKYDEKGLEKIGKLIDITFECNYLNVKHSQIYFRVLKADIKEPVED